MKKSIFTLTFLLFVAVQIFTQTPQAINFQAVARNANGDPKANTAVDVRFIIHKNSTNGATEYDSGVQSTQTDDCGMFALQIGSTNSTDFANINWASGSKFLEVRVDGTMIGNQQMVSVPYALYAEKSKIISGQGIQPVETNTAVRLQNEDIPSTHVTVPESGTYLILANLAVESMQPGDATLGGFVVKLIPGGSSPLFDFRVATKPNGQTVVSSESTGWGMATLSKNDIVSLQSNMSSWVSPSETQPYKVLRGKIMLIKL